MEETLFMVAFENKVLSEMAPSSSKRGCKRKAEGHFHVKHWGVLHNKGYRVVRITIHGEQVTIVNE